MFLNGCAFMEKLKLDDLIKPYGHSESKRDKTKKKDTGDRIALLLQKVNGHLSRQNPLEALAVLRKNQIESMNEPVVTGRYIAALNMALEQAAEAEETGDYLEAGKLYRSVSAFYPQASDTVRLVKMTQSEIDDRINICADRILDKGLGFYRVGDLRKAIETWSQIEHFHPTHTASEKAIQTTRTQIKNLKEITREPEPAL